MSLNNNIIVSKIEAQYPNIAGFFFPLRSTLNSGTTDTNTDHKVPLPALFCICFDLHHILQIQEITFLYHNNSLLINLMLLSISFSLLEYN